jgi:hypothetical protein
MNEKSKRNEISVAIEPKREEKSEKVQSRREFQQHPAREKKAGLRM